MIPPAQNAKFQDLTLFGPRPRQAHQDDVKKWKMKKETILDFIKKGESEKVEFKSAFDQAAIETLAALANTKGGYVFVGVADSGKIIGVQLGNETIPQWLN